MSLATIPLLNIIPNNIMTEDKSKKSLQDTFLNDLRKNKTNVSVFMVNGIKLDGVITSFDQFSIMLGGKVDQLVYKQKISTIVPAGHTHAHSHAPRHKERDSE